MQSSPEPSRRWWRIATTSWKGSRSFSRRLKNQLSVKSSDGETTSFCFRSKELIELTKMCRDLRHKVLEILENALPEFLVSTLPKTP
ncbi:hypothetical protein JHK82_053452 [Glycine max]|nr:hypothetical protein JHK86_053304 [Glycine max]KAG4927758.1 hypothetical protein JHK85_054244 [Glycine max]KAG5083283.1 hypothetical protein JHK84_053321 [Glycine max]KAG5086055.1 hypothetical protein JHK82_053452 [Glycine max]